MMKTKYFLLAVLILRSLFHELYAQSDTPCGAPFLAVNSMVCNFTTGTTVGASYQNDPASGGIPYCAFPGSPDVWYAIVVPASGAIAITTREGTITDGGMQVYDGPCTNPHLLECDDDDAINMMPVIDRSDYIPGDTIYVRFWKAAGAGTGTFEICVVESHSDCISASFVCKETHMDGNAYGPGSNVDAIYTNCEIYEYQSHWLKFKVLYPGSFWFKIYPDSIGPQIYPDYDWILFQDSNSAFCQTFTDTVMSVACNSSSSYGPQGETGLDVSGVSNSVPPGPGNPFCPILNVVAGEVYYLFINNYSNSSSGFNFSVGGSASLDCDLITHINVPPQTNDERVTICPNPCHGRTILSISSDLVFTSLELKVYDALGRKIKTIENIRSHEINFDTENMGFGLYFFQLTDGESIFYPGKFIIE